MPVSEQKLYGFTSEISLFSFPVEQHWFHRTDKSSQIASKHWYKLTFYYKDQPILFWLQVDTGTWKKGNILQHVIFMLSD